MQLLNVSSLDVRSMLVGVGLGAGLVLIGARLKAAPAPAFDDRLVDVLRDIKLLLEEV